MAKRQISQETFNDVVKENMEEFDMEADEAVQDAVEQFETQGVDLSNIVKALALDSVGAGSSDENPILAHLASLKLWEAQEDSGERANSFDLDAQSVTGPLSELLSSMEEADTRRLVGAKEGLSILLQVIENLASLVSSEDKSEVESSAASALQLSLQVLAKLLDGQPDLLTPPNPNSVMAEAKQDHKQIKQICKHVRNLKHAPHIQQHAMTAIRHACTKHETNRQTFIGEGLMELLLHCVEEHTDAPEAVAEAARCLRVLTFDDDIRVAFGKGHDHAKLMVNDHRALPRIMNTLSAFTDNADTTAELCRTLAKLAVRNEYCQEIVDLGGLELLLPSLTAHEDDIAVATSSLQVLRAIAGNDDVKLKIREVGGIEAIVNTMSHHVKQAAVQDKGCAALAAICLRQTENSKAAVEAGGAHAIVKAMVMFPDKVSLQKNACRALRNMAARSPELRPAILAESAEHYLNVAMARKECFDDAKAALRDLGCKVHLNEEWKGKGAGVSA